MLNKPCLPGHAVPRGATLHVQVLHGYGATILEKMHAKNAAGLEALRGARREEATR